MKDKNIFIAGGTSGIGLALAKYYLNIGSRVAIVGRDKQRISNELIKSYKNLTIFELNIYNKKELEYAINHFAEDGLDIVYAVAGAYANTRTANLTREEVFNMVNTNLIGTINVFDVCSKILVNQKYGSIVAISSVAGLLDYPGASVYSHCKKTVIDICKTYDRALSDFCVDVTAIVPGYINTKKLRDLNNGDASHKLFIMEECDAVKEIVKAVEGRLKIHIFPLRMKLLINILRWIPYRLLSFVLLRKN